jgi:ADP-heptose:LPS heptosyltransferase
MNLDLVITVDTSVAHLAGALGKPVWILVPANGEWRWLEKRTDSPWYPTARLFRQQEVGDWTQAIEALREALAEKPKRASTRKPAANVDKADKADKAEKAARSRKPSAASEPSPDQP